MWGFKDCWRLPAVLVSGAGRLACRWTQRRKPRGSQAPRTRSSGVDQHGWQSRQVGTSKHGKLLDADVLHVPETRLAKAGRDAFRSKLPAVATSPTESYTGFLASRQREAGAKTGSGEAY